jgi:hypothetical protein
MRIPFVSPFANTLPTHFSQFHRIFNTMSNSPNSSTTESSTGCSRPPLAPINTNELENRRNGKKTSQATTTTPARETAAPYNAQQRSTRRTLRVDTGRNAQPTHWATPPNETTIRDTAINNLQSVYLRLQSERTKVLAERASYLCDAFGAFDIPPGQDLEDIDSFNLTHDRVYTSLQEHATRLDKHVASVQELIQQFEFAVKRGHLFDDFGYLRTNTYLHGPLFGLTSNQVAKERSYVSEFAPPSPTTVRRNLEPMSPSDMTEAQLARSRSQP